MTKKNEGIRITGLVVAILGGVTWIGSWLFGNNPLEQTNSLLFAIAGLLMILIGK